MLNSISHLGSDVKFHGSTCHECMGNLHVDGREQRRGHYIIILHVFINTDSRNHFIIFL